MLRKLLIVAVAVTMMFGFSGASADDAEAQTVRCRQYYNIIVTCPGTGSITDNFTIGQGSGSAAASGGTSSGASTTTGGAADAGTTSLAVTGAESEVLGYVGAGLVGVGCLAAATARRRSRDLN